MGLKDIFPEKEKLKEIRNKGNIEIFYKSQRKIWGFRKESVMKTFEIIKDSFVDDEIDNRNKVLELESRIEKIN